MEVRNKELESHNRVMDSEVRGLRLSVVKANEACKIAQDEAERMRVGAGELEELKKKVLELEQERDVLKKDAADHALEVGKAFAEGAEHIRSSEELRQLLVKQYLDGFEDFRALCIERYPHSDIDFAGLELHDDPPPVEAVAPAVANPQVPADPAAGGNGIIPDDGPSQDGGPPLEFNCLLIS